MQLCGVSGTRESVDDSDGNLHVCLAVDATVRVVVEGSSADVQKHAV
jgi:hypothetical protein